MANLVRHHPSRTLALVVSFVATIVAPLKRHLQLETNLSVAEQLVDGRKTNHRRQSDKYKNYWT